MRSPPRRRSSAGRPRLAVGIEPPVPAKKTDRSMALSLSAEGYQLEAQLAALDQGNSHARPRRAPALRRAPGVEDLKPVLGPLVQREVRVAKDDGVGGGEATSQTAEPAVSRPGVVDDGDPSAGHVH